MAVAKAPREWAVMEAMFRNQPPQQDDLLRMLGRLVVTWNQMEGIVRSLLINICGSTQTTQVLTAELTAEGLANALLASALVAGPSELLEEIKFVKDKMDLLRVYRNDYIHGAVGSGAVDERFGVHISNKSAKGHLVIHEQVVAPYDLYLVTEAILQLGLHTSELCASLILHRNMGRPLAVPQRPALPRLHLRTRKRVPPDRPSGRPSQA